MPVPGDATAGYVSFLTDYGLADGFVAACHGVLLDRAPGVHIIDITHLVPAGDVRRGSVVLAQTVRHLPPAVHLAVVDPGVGTARRAIAVSTPRGILVGPDNGLLPPAADTLGGVRRAVALPVPDGTPATFHGRDVFAPAAAALVAGRDPVTLGVPVDPASLVRLAPPVARFVSADPAEVEVEVVTTDHFGNIALAADPALLAAAGLAPGRIVRIMLASSVTQALFGVTFGSVRPGELVVYVDSSGLAALAVNGGSAAERLGAKAGDLVRLASPGA